MGPRSLNVLREKWAESILTLSSSSVGFTTLLCQENMHPGPPLGAQAFRRSTLGDIQSVPFSFLSLPHLSKKPSRASSPHHMIFHGPSVPKPPHSQGLMPLRDLGILQKILQGP